MKYVQMNKVDSVFAKADSLVEVSFDEPLFLGSLIFKSMIPRYHGIWINDMKDVMWYMQNDMCYVYDLMCYMQNDMCYV